jgi:predicted Zn-dependent protease
MFRAPLAFALLVVTPVPLIAHEGLHEQIEAITRQLAATPGNAVLHLKRGELHRLHGEAPLAARDYDQAARLDPTLAAVHLGRGLLLLDTGRAAEALAPLGKYLAARPDDDRGRIALARAMLRSGRAAEAAAEFDVVIKASPDPDLVLERADALVRALKPKDALHSLDDAMRRLGPLVTLQLAAADIEIGARDYDAALRRLTVAESAAERKETWRARRGDILVKAGRIEEARAAYQSALDAIATLPPNRRATRAIIELEERLNRAVAAENCH